MWLHTSRLSPIASENAIRGHHVFKWSFFQPVTERLICRLICKINFESCQVQKNYIKNQELCWYFSQLSYRRLMQIFSCSKVYTWKHIYIYMTLSINTVYPASWSRLVWEESTITVVYKGSFKAVNCYLTLKILNLPLEPQENRLDCTIPKYDKTLSPIHHHHTHKLPKVNIPGLSLVPNRNLFLPTHLSEPGSENFT